ncbi:COG2426 family protein [Candidatus Omnitrophota bacterium]
MVGTNELKILAVAALPVFELRASIPLGLYYWGQEQLIKVFTLSVIGNFVPIIPLLLLLEPLSNKLRNFVLWKKFFEWFFEKTKKKAHLVEKYEALGLALFVAIPLPGSGIWTGTVAAILFKIKFRYAFIAIVCGMLLAGILVSLVSVGVLNLPMFIKKL